MTEERRKRLAVLRQHAAKLKQLAMDLDKTGWELEEKAGRLLYEARVDLLRHRTFPAIARTLKIKATRCFKKADQVRVSAWADEMEITQLRKQEAANA